MTVSHAYFARPCAELDVERLVEVLVRLTRDGPLEIV